jgi:P4 family phage/plasmid primase-like protien
MQTTPEHLVFKDDTILNQLMYESLRGTNIVICNVFHHLFRDTMNCTKDKIWYVFDKHRWINDVSEVNKNLTIKMKSYYFTMRRFYQRIPGDESKKVIQYLNNVISKLENEAPAVTIISRSQLVFYNHNKSFESLLNKNVYLFGCDNGVYDLKNDLFRDGLPNDYITCTCGYDFDKTRNLEYEIKINEMIDQIMPIVNVKKFVMKLLAVCLSGLTNDQLMFLFNGGGSNGKSILITLVSMVLGNYFAKGPIAMLTQKRCAAEQATPQLNKTMHSRLVLFSEPKADDTFNSGVIKELTGGEVMSNRNLHASPTDFLPQFKIIVLCNSLPKVDDNTHGTWRRLRNISFPSRFVNKPDPTKKNQFKLDKFLANNFEAWKTTFLHILIDYFRIYMVEGLIDIPEIMETTEKYQKDSDYYREFADSSIAETNNKSDGILWSDLKSSFEDWYRINYNNVIPNVKITKKYFIDNVFNAVEPSNVRFPTESSNKGKLFFGWRGYKLSSDNDNQVSAD